MVKKTIFLYAWDQMTSFWVIFGPKFCKKKSIFWTSIFFQNFEIL